MNTTEVITALRIKGSFPASDDLFSTADFLVLMNMAMQVEINPMMLKLNDEYLLTTKDYVIAAGSTYRLPTRCINVRDIQYIDGSGNITDLIRNFEEDRASARSGFYITRNSIELSIDYTSGTLRVKYFARPSKLVATTNCGQILSIDPVLNLIVVSSAPATFVNGVLIDMVQNTNPYDLLSMDQILTSVAGTTLSFASLPTGLAVGDWICIANESPVPLAPEEMHPVLVQSCLVECLSSKKDSAYKAAAEKLSEMKKQVINMLAPRVDNTSAKMRSGLLHRSFFSGRWF